MNIDCHFCGKKYKIDENKIISKKVRVKCTTCGHFITVEKPRGKPGKSGENGAAPPAPGKSPEKPGDHVLPAPGRETPFPAGREADLARENGTLFPMEEDPFSREDRPLSPSEEEAPHAAVDGAGFSMDEAGAFTSEEESPAPQGEEADLEPLLEEETSETDLVPNIEKVGFFNRIQIRICGVLFLLTAIILTGFGGYSYITAKDRISRDLNVTARITAKRMAVNLESALLNGEKIRVGDSLNAEMLNKNIHAILVRGRDGKTIFSGRRRSPAGKAVPASGNIRGDYIKSRKDVYHQARNEKIGSVEVHLTPELMEKALNRSILNIIIMALILIVAMGAALSFSLRKMVIKPIMKLTRDTEKMSLGELRVSIDVKSKNEIGSLARAIERMQGSIRTALKRIRGKV